MSEHEQHFNIFIDKIHYKVNVDSMTGSQIKVQGNIPSEYELWLEVPGHTDDQIGDTETVHFKSGDRFFSVPPVINPGARG